MADINIVSLTGRIGSDIELKRTITNKNVCSFPLAIERVKRKEEEKASVDWIDIVAWEHTAEYCSKYLTKGQRIAVKGKLITRAWQDNNGLKRKAVEIIAEQIVSIGKKSNAAENYESTSYSAPSSDTDFEEIPDDDNLPF